MRRQDGSMGGCAWSWSCPGYDGADASLPFPSHPRLHWLGQCSCLLAAFNCKLQGCRKMATSHGPHSTLAVQLAKMKVIYLPAQWAWGHPELHSMSVKSRRCFTTTSQPGIYSTSSILPPPVLLSSTSFSSRLPGQMSKDKAAKIF